jgi:formate hydrogenlyase subunit 6/NADH:ubiquinone oxidoreductase subunit I
MSVFIEREKCKGCALCVPVCPVQAISMVDDKAIIDQKKCNACLRCIDECPTDAIRHTFEKEVYLVKSEQTLPDLSEQSTLTDRKLSSISKWRQQTVKREPAVIDRLIRAVDRLFEFYPSPGMRGKGKRGRQRRQRGRHKGRRF